MMAVEAGELVEDILDPGAGIGEDAPREQPHEAQRGPLEEDEGERDRERGHTCRPGDRAKLVGGRRIEQGDAQHPKAEQREQQLGEHLGGKIDDHCRIDAG